MPAQLLKALSAAASALEASADELNRLDGFAGDGDMGITMTQAARAVQEVAQGGDDRSPAEVLSACGAAVARRAPSTSGTLVATAFLRAAKALADSDALSATEVMARCFGAALEGVQARGKASVGDRTLVDGLHAVDASFRRSVGAGQGWQQALAEAAIAAQEAAEATVEMEPKIGRASWVPQRALGHADAGCTMLALVLRAAAEPDGSSSGGG